MERREGGEGEKGDLIRWGRTFSLGLFVFMVIVLHYRLRTEFKEKKDQTFSFTRLHCQRTEIKPAGLIVEFGIARSRETLSKRGMSPHLEFPQAAATEGRGWRRSGGGGGLQAG